MASAVPTALTTARPRVAVAPCPCGATGNWTKESGVPCCTACRRPLLVTPRPDAPREREEGARG